ncbi:MAG: hypothetical protein L6R40_008271 [Gallowayella cf. fulva]|nr:MAG: hypothetical protein L6R40_008271 [Xanthomendoza cf. fulva]
MVGLQVTSNTATVTSPATTSTDFACLASTATTSSYSISATTPTISPPTAVPPPPINGTAQALVDQLRTAILYVSLVGNDGNLAKLCSVINPAALFNETGINGTAVQNEVCSAAAIAKYLPRLAQVVVLNNQKGASYLHTALFAVQAVSRFGGCANRTTLCDEVDETLINNLFIAYINGTGTAVKKRQNFRSNVVLTSAPFIVVPFSIPLVIVSFTHYLTSPPRFDLLSTLMRPADSLRPLSSVDTQTVDIPLTLPRHPIFPSPMSYSNSFIALPIFVRESLIRLLRQSHPRRDWHLRAPLTTMGQTLSVARSGLPTSHIISTVASTGKVRWDMETLQEVSTLLFLTTPWVIGAARATGRYFAAPTATTAKLGYNQQTPLQPVDQIPADPTSRAEAQADSIDDLPLDAPATSTAGDAEHQNLRPKTSSPNSSTANKHVPVMANWSTTVAEEVDPGPWAEAAFYHLGNTIEARNARIEARDETVTEVTTSLPVTANPLATVDNVDADKKDETIKSQDVEIRAKDEIIHAQAKEMQQFKKSQDVLSTALPMSINRMNRRADERKKTLDRNATADTHLDVDTRQNNGLRAVFKLKGVTEALAAERTGRKVDAEKAKADFTTMESKYEAAMATIIAKHETETGETKNEHCQNINQLTQELQDSKAIVIQVEKDSHLKSEEITDLKSKLKKLEEAAEDQRSEKQELTTKVNEALQQLTTSHGQVDALQQSNGHLKVALEAAQETAQAMSDENDEKEKENEVLKAEIGQVRAENEGLGKQASSRERSVRRHNRARKAEIEELSNSNNKKDSDIQALKKDNDVLKKHVFAVETARDTLQWKVWDSEKEIRELRKRLVRSPRCQVDACCDANTICKQSQVPPAPSSVPLPSSSSVPIPGTASSTVLAPSTPPPPPALSGSATSSEPSSIDGLVPSSIPLPPSPPSSPSQTTPPPELLSFSNPSFLAAPCSPAESATSSASTGNTTASLLDTDVPGDLSFDGETFTTCQKVPSAISTTAGGSQTTNEVESLSEPTFRPILTNESNSLHNSSASVDSAGSCPAENLVDPGETKGPYGPLMTATSDENVITSLDTPLPKATPSIADTIAGDKIVPQPESHDAPSPASPTSESVETTAAKVDTATTGPPPVLEDDRAPRDVDPLPAQTLEPASSLVNATTVPSNEGVPHNETSEGTSNVQSTVPIETTPQISSEVPVQTSTVSDIVADELGQEAVASAEKPSETLDNAPQDERPSGLEGDDCGNQSMAEAALIQDQGVKAGTNIQSVEDISNDKQGIVNDINDQPMGEVVRHQLLDRSPQLTLHQPRDQEDRIDSDMKEAESFSVPPSQQESEPIPAQLYDNGDREMDEAAPLPPASMQQVSADMETGQPFDNAPAQGADSSGEHEMEDAPQVSEAPQTSVPAFANLTNDQGQWNPPAGDFSFRQLFPESKLAPPTVTGFGQPQFDAPVQAPAESQANDFPEEIIGDTPSSDFDPFEASNNAANEGIPPFDAEMEAFFGGDGMPFMEAEQIEAIRMWDNLDEVIASIKKPTEQDKDATSPDLPTGPNTENAQSQSQPTAAHVPETPLTPDAFIGPQPFDPRDQPQPEVLVSPASPIEPAAQSAHSDDDMSEDTGELAEALHQEFENWGSDDEDKEAGTMKEEDDTPLLQQWYEEAAINRLWPEDAPPAPAPAPPSAYISIAPDTSDDESSPSTSQVGTEQRTTVAFDCSSDEDEDPSPKKIPPPVQRKIFTPRRLRLRQEANNPFKHNQPNERTQPPIVTVEGVDDNDNLEADDGANPRKQTRNTPPSSADTENQPLSSTLPGLGAGGPRPDRPGNGTVFSDTNLFSPIPHEDKVFSDYLDDTVKAQQDVKKGKPKTEEVESDEDEEVIWEDAVPELFENGSKGSHAGMKRSGNGADVGKESGVAASSSGAHPFNPFGLAGSRVAGPSGSPSGSRPLQPQSSSLTNPHYRPPPLQPWEMTMGTSPLSSMQRASSSFSPTKPHNGSSLWQSWTPDGSLPSSPVTQNTPAATSSRTVASGSPPSTLPHTPKSPSPLRSSMRGDIDIDGDMAHDDSVDDFYNDSASHGDATKDVAKDDFPDAQNEGDIGGGNEEPVGRDDDGVSNEDSLFDDDGFDADFYAKTEEERLKDQERRLADQDERNRKINEYYRSLQEDDG